NDFGMRTAQHDLRAVAPRPLRRERGCRPEHLGVGGGGFPQPFRELGRSTFDRLDLLRLRRQEHEPSEGWISETPAPGQLGLREGEVVVRRGGEYRVVLGEVRLKNAAAAGSTSARSSQDLREQLKGTLGRGEVRQVEHRVGVDDTDEGHPRQVEALRQHLRANDHLRITRAHPLVGGRMRALRAHGVAVQSDDLRPRDRGSHLFLHALRSDAQLSDSRTAADRAPFRGARLTATPQAELRPRAGAASTAWSRGSLSCLSDGSCSWSATTRPFRSGGAKSADREPMTTSAAPSRTRRHSSKRSPAESALCSSATRSPKRAMKRATTCAVRTISGTRTMTPSPRASVSAAARRYTSVFPLAVTPCSRKPRPLPSAAMIAASAAAC